MEGGMHVLARLLLGAVAVSPIALLGQISVFTPSIPMSPDRVADSYAIYSSLIPVGETAGKNWPHDLWLVADATIGMSPDTPCKPTAPSLAPMNPHFAVVPPENDKQDYAEILADFDAHCHERIALAANGWTTTAPVRLLSPAEQEEFRAARFASPEPESAVAAKYKGAPALYSFSQVYFNTGHTVALVEASLWCGSQCAQSFWVALGKENWQWKPMAGAWGIRVMVA
jgi:hypothetical protein